MSNDTESGPTFTGVKLAAMVGPDGDGYLSGCTYGCLPAGLRITGNGTLTHPLTVELSPLYAAAPELLEALIRIADQIDAVIAKATEEAR